MERISSRTPRQGNQQLELAKKFTEKLLFCPTANLALITHTRIIDQLGSLNCSTAHLLFLACKFEPSGWQVIFVGKQFKDKC